MTETTRTIFEKYEVRKTKKQKTAFIEWVKTVATQARYDFNVEKGWFGARNIVIGDPDKAKVIYTAHYDTCARLPFPNFITPKCFLLYLLYQIALVLSIFIVMFGAGIILALLHVPAPIATIMGEGIALALFLLIMFGPANKHTANDNTSGVTVVLDTLNALPTDLRSNVAFILFDLEEVGLFGSSSYYSKHKKTLENKLLINFDCVSDGNNILISVKKKAKAFVPILKEAFKDNDNYSVEVASKGVFYPSDQTIFPCGVAVAALKRTKWFGVLYMNRIHTKRDTVYQQGNIDFLVASAVEIPKYLKKD